MPACARLTLLAAGALALGACTMPQPPAETAPLPPPPSLGTGAPPAPGADAGLGGSTAQCNAQAAQSLVGQLAVVAVTDQAEALAGVETSRVIGPGQPVTQDFRANRLNIETDAENRIRVLRCG